jgi:hypothetical protein
MDRQNGHQGALEAIQAIEKEGMEAPARGSGGYPADETTIHAFLTEQLDSTSILTAQAYCENLWREFLHPVLAKKIDWSGGSACPPGCLSKELDQEA